MNQLKHVRLLLLLTYAVLSQSRSIEENGEDPDILNKAHLKTASLKSGRPAYDRLNINNDFLRSQSLNPNYDPDIFSGVPEFADRIIGGDYATLGEFPWQANLLHKSGSGASHQCGSTIINEFWLLTAAHCFIYEISSYTITVGNLNLNRSDKGEQVFGIARIIKHESYKPEVSGLDYDIALIKIKPSANGRGIQFNDYVQPARLPYYGMNIPDGAMLSVSGWGLDSEFGSPEILKKAVVPFVSQQRCKPLVLPWTLTDRMLCAGYPGGQTGVCGGDSGGGLMYKTGGSYTVVGVASWKPTLGCSTPSTVAVYADVRILVPWIRSNMQ